MANFLFILSKEDAESGTRCFQMSKIAHSKGHQVNLFFIGEGVRWADKTKDWTAKTLTGDSPGDYMPYLVENEVPVGV